MLFGIMPYLMEMQHKAEKKNLEDQIADRDRRIKSLEKIVAYDVEEIKILKDRIVALGGDPDCGMGARLLAETPMPTRNKRARVSKL